MGEFRVADLRWESSRELQMGEFANYRWESSRDFMGEFSLPTYRWESSQFAFFSSPICKLEL